jgi:hypothetical protein
MRYGLVDCSNDRDAKQKMVMAMHTSMVIDVRPVHLDKCSTHKELTSFIAKRNVAGMLIAFIALKKNSGMLFERLKDGPERGKRKTQCS